MEVVAGPTVFPRLRGTSVVAVPSITSPSVFPGPKWGQKGLFRGKPQFWRILPLESCFQLCHRAFLYCW